MCARNPKYPEVYLPAPEESVYTVLQRTSPIKKVQFTLQSLYYILIRLCYVQRFAIYKKYSAMSYIIIIYFCIVVVHCTVV